MIIFYTIEFIFFSSEQLGSLPKNLKKTEKHIIFGAQIQ